MAPDILDCLSKRLEEKRESDEQIEFWEMTGYEPIKN